MLGLAEPIAKISIPPRLGKLLTRRTAADERTIPQNKVQPSLGYLVDRAAAKKQRLSLTYQNQAFVAIVPIEDDERFEEIEDCVDGANIDALKEEGESLSSEQVYKILGG
jgi:hypothetical protein